MGDRHASILGLGTAAPASLEQTHILQVAQSLCCETDAQRQIFARIFSRSGVDRRGVVTETPESSAQDFFPPGDPPSTGKRMRAFAQFAPGLAERASRRALDEAQIEEKQITHVITVSCTGFVSPGLDADLIERLGLSRQVKRLNIGFMGCHAALNALAAAQAIAKADPQALVLVCCVELCTLHMAYGTDVSRWVTNALFADGAAAAVVGVQPSRRGWSILQTASLLIPDTRPDMGWLVGDQGFEMILSPNVPARVEEGVRPWCAQWLGRGRTSIEGIDHWAIHPGGPKVLTATARGLGLDESHLACSRDILREHGNVSSATILFILQRLGSASGYCVSLAFGPGLTMEGILLHR